MNEEKRIEFQPAVNKRNPEDRPDLCLYLAAQMLALLGEIGILTGDCLMGMANRVMEESMDARSDRA